MTAEARLMPWRRCAECHRHLELIGGPTEKEPDAGYRIPHHTRGMVPDGDGYRAPRFGELKSVRRRRLRRQPPGRAGMSRGVTRRRRYSRRLHDLAQRPRDDEEYDEGPSLYLGIGSAGTLGADAAEDELGFYLPDGTWRSVRGPRSIGFRGDDR